MSLKQSLAGRVGQRFVIPCLALLALIGCSSDAKRTATRFSREDFAILHWIEGDWRGQIASGGTFYERYKFVDDSTIMMRGFEDSTFTHPNDSATIVFRDGVVTDRGPSARWSATRLDARGIDFSPVQGARNRFSWNRESADKWTAAILRPKGDSTVYHMERVRPR